jgi:regulator of RNase E activity RraA
MTSSFYEQIKGLSTTHFCDAGANRILTPLLKPMTNHSDMFGSVFTVSSFGDLLPIIRAIESAPKKSVLMITTNGSNKAVAGEIFATTAAKRGLAGIVIDGYCRDLSGIAKANIPFFAKGIYPQAGTKEIEGQLNTPICINNHLIRPGDFILADESGLIVLDKNEISQLLPVAKTISLKENSALEALQKPGFTLKDILNYEEHLKAIRNKEESQLQWTVDL